MAPSSADALKLGASLHASQSNITPQPPHQRSGPTTSPEISMPAFTYVGAVTVVLTAPSVRSLTPPYSGSAGQLLRMADGSEIATAATITAPARGLAWMRARLVRLECAISRARARQVLVLL